MKHTGKIIGYPISYNFWLGVLIFGFLFLRGQGFSQEIKVKDATGLIFQWNKPPQKIISLNPSATETICALGGEDELIAVTSFCRYPEEVKSKDKIGTILEPDIEKIVSLRPDLVLATKEGNRKKTIEKIRELGIKVFTFDSIYRFEDIYERVSLSGRLLGRREEAGRLISDMKHRIEEIKGKVKGRPKVKVFWQYGLEPIITANKKTLANEMIELAGGSNIARDALLRYPRYSLEEVTIQNPEVIILTSMESFGEDALDNWRQFKSIPAVKNNRIYLIDSDLVCNMGPRLIEGLEKIARALHPEAFANE